MPTVKEIRAQAEAEGLGDAEIAQRIAEAQKAGTLTAESTAEPLVKYRPFSEMESPPEVGGLTGVLHDIYTRPQRQGEFLRQVQESEPFTRSARAGEFLQEVTTGQPSKSTLEKEAALAPPPEEPPGPATPSLLAPGAGEIALQTAQARPIPMPSSAAMEAAKGERQRGYEEQLARIGTLASKEQETIQKMTDVEAERARAAAKISEDRQREYEQLQVRNRDRELKRQDYIKGELGKVQQLVDQVQSMKVDPYSFYKHPDGSVDYPKSIAAAIAVGLGALGASLPAQYGGTGGPNVALQIIDKAIAREIDAQKSDIANKRAGAGLQMNLLSQAKGLLDDERLQDKGAELALLKSFEIKLDAALARTADRKVLANGELLKVQIQQREENVFGQIINLANDKAVQDEEKKYMMESQAAARMAKAQAKGSELRKLPPDLEMLPGAAPLPEKALGEVRKMWTQYPNVRTLLGRLINYRMKEGVTALGQKKFYFDDDFAKARADALDLIVELKQVKGMGAHFTEMEKFLLNVPENPGAFGKWQSSLQRKLENAEMGKDNFLKAYNIRDISKRQLEGEAAAQ